MEIAIKRMEIEVRAPRVNGAVTMDKSGSGDARPVD